MPLQPEFEGQGFLPTASPAAGSCKQSWMDECIELRDKVKCAEARAGHFEIQRQEEAEAHRITIEALERSQKQEAYLRGFIRDELAKVKARIQKVADAQQAADPKEETVLEEADRIVDGDRAAAYGSPMLNHGRTAKGWTWWLRDCRGLLKDDAEVEPEDVCQLNSLQKKSRESYAPKRDNIVDDIGYMRNVEKIKAERLVPGYHP